MANIGYYWALDLFKWKDKTMEEMRGYGIRLVTESRREGGRHQHLQTRVRKKVEAST